MIYPAQTWSNITLWSLAEPLKRQNMHPLKITVGVEWKPKSFTKPNKTQNMTGIKSPFILIEI